jgi:hypothetical protein
MRTFSSLLVAAVTVTAASQVATADNAKPAPQVEAIRSLIGSWAGKGTQLSEGKTYPVNVTWDCAESAGAAGVKCKFVMTGIPGFTYMFDDLWGYSPQDGLTHWYTVTNAGEVHDHRGHFDMSGGQLEVQLANEGKVFSEVITFKRKGKALAVSWTVSHGGTLREKGDIQLQPKTK